MSNQPTPSAGAVRVATIIAKDVADRINTRQPLIVSEAVVANIIDKELGAQDMADNLSFILEFFSQYLPAMTVRDAEKALAKYKGTN